MIAITANIPINPRLPANFDSTPNVARPASHLRWWGRPYIVTQDWDGHGDYDAWHKAWPSGTRYNVRCLDGGAWDRSTKWGMFATLEEAIRCAESV